MGYTAFSAGVGVVNNRSVRKEESRGRNIVARLDSVGGIGCLGWDGMGIGWMEWDGGWDGMEYNEIVCYGSVGIVNNRKVSNEEGCWVLACVFDAYVP